MADQSDHPQVATHPPLIFLGFLVAALILGWAFPILIPWTLALHGVGSLTLIAGVLISGSALMQMIRAETSPDPYQPATTLVTAGPYKFTRNPIYLGFFCVYLGFTLLAGTLWGILLAPLLILTVNRLIIRAEEAYLEGKFRKKYTDYKASVRRWL